MSTPNSFIKRIDDLIFGKLQNHYARELEASLADCHSILDVGCGAYSPIRFFSKDKFAVGVDAFQPSIDRSKEAGIHNEYKLMNILDLDKEFKENSFDAVIASDVIEHLPKEEGYKLISLMEKIASKKVIIFTPNGFLEQKAYDGNELQVHLSGWDYKEMKDLGYKVKGINGLKLLKGEFAEVKWKPKVFWGRVSLLTQPYTTHNPKNAFAILCEKKIH